MAESFFFVYLVSNLLITPLLKYFGPHVVIGANIELTLSLSYVDNIKFFAIYNMIFW